ncbi:hypothetical protein LGL55_17650 [Clostridium tagluense]|uniref:hypothetical protein n=1 Tax=Clostridium tagluense TaxID=360422 RepID=UPI001CF576E5|nr:hypothetical protein [Clostridium tagluense]MCB2313104.1 hypothetical protein [Clostridium tagluense]MCB2317870.1 hypothetical protein [Clostridium tagluense]MCB2322655.1 hypothetical protein [Clostridium tagluense]MCB2327691.1 hypothetical protein [Clostridium tagluense]MCB2332300.1 hypothetical protein [Clostridium tagluense]
MSAFLAPIHTWLFNKILLAEELEKSLKEVYIDKYKDVAKEVVEKSLVYGSPIDITKNIEDIIDKSNIHGWLQDKISTVETRTAYVITEMIKKCGEDAQGIAELSFKKQGRTVGETLKAKEMPEGAEELYNALNIYLLEGMPCDRVTRIIKSEKNVLEWETTSCIHKKYWEMVNGDVNIFYNLRHSWIKAFIENSNEKYTYNFIEGLEYNDARSVNQIIAK